MRLFEELRGHLVPKARHSSTIFNSSRIGERHRFVNVVLFRHKSLDDDPR